MTGLGGQGHVSGGRGNLSSAGQGGLREVPCEEQEAAWVVGSPVLQPLSLLSSGTPKGVDFTAVRNLLLSVEGVEALHSLHIWALTVAQPILSVHIAIGEWWSTRAREAARDPGAIPARLAQMMPGAHGAGALDLTPCRVLGICYLFDHQGPIYR